MRTPKHKRMIQKAKNTATGKLRKKAMRNKMYKKTLLEVGGDDTREDVRDLMNESDMSFNGVDFKEKVSSTPVVTAEHILEPEPEKSMSKKMSGMMTKSMSLVTMKTAETTDKLASGIMKKTKSLRSLRSKRKHSNEENIDKSVTDDDEKTESEEKKAKIDDIKEPLEDAQNVNNLPGLSIHEQAYAKFAGVKNMLSSAVWGVPYAKVVEDPLEVSVMEPELEVARESSQGEVVNSEDNPSNCIIA